ncbi:ESRP2 [Scenedesmus sp. PABB004]|nr:ESRP2 [Scenedesmus sp. PABB004]
MGKRYIEVFISSLSDLETARRMCTERGAPAALQAPAGGADQAAAELPLMMQTYLKLQQGADQPQPDAAAGAAGAAAAAAAAQQQQQQQASALLLHAQQQQAAAIAQQAQAARPPAQQIVRLRGLPFSASEADVQAFLAPIELPGGAAAVHLARHPDLRPTGEAYVQLRSEAEVLAALKKHKSTMGKRYIEVFPSCLAEMQQVLSAQMAAQSALLSPALAASTPFVTPAPPPVFAGIYGAQPQLGQYGGQYGGALRQQQPAAPAGWGGGSYAGQHNNLLVAAAQQALQAQQAHKTALAAQLRAAQAAQQQPYGYLVDRSGHSFTGHVSGGPLVAASGGSFTLSGAGSGGAPGLDLQPPGMAAVAAAAAAAAASGTCTSSGDLQYLPFYTPGSGLAAPPGGVLVLGPGGLGGSFTSQPAPLSSAGINAMMSSSSAMDSATAAATALCNESLVSGPHALRAGSASLFLS